MSIKLKVADLGNGDDVNHCLYVHYAERILFSVPEGEDVDYVRLDIETRFYDPDYERAIRKKNLNLIYFLDDIRLHLERPTSQCIDILIDIERRLARAQMVGEVHHIKNLEQYVLRLSDLLISEGEFLKVKLTAQEYAALVYKAPHMDVPADFPIFLMELKTLSNGFREDADHLMRYALT